MNVVHRRRDHGSVLMLMPAGVLIVLVLGAIAVDSAVLYLRQREAHNVAFDAANDAVGAGLDVESVRATGEIVYDPARVQAIASAAVDAAANKDLVLVSAVPDGTAVVVTVEYTVRHVFVQAFGDPASDTLRIAARVDGVTRGPSDP